MSDSIWLRLGLPADTCRAIRLLRIDGKIVVHDPYTEMLAAEEGADPSKFCEPQNGFFKNSFMMKRIHENAVSIHSFTMRGGEVAHNFDCVVTISGILVEGTVNDSNAGPLPMDQQFIDELFEGSRIKWDFYERGQYEDSESE